jgi:hypothetical protein
MGLEPTNGGTTNHCLNHLATLAITLCLPLYQIYSNWSRVFAEPTQNILKSKKYR